MPHTSTALRDAIRSKDASRVARVLEDQPDLKARLNEPLDGGAFGGTALLAAAGQANGDIIDVLLAAGADINQKSHWWAGPFGVMDDAWREPWMPEFLIARGARLEIHHAVRLGMIDEVRRMLDADPGLVHGRGGDGQLPLHFAQTIEMVEYLLGRSADINARDVDHESTAAQYMVRDRQDLARLLVNRGGDTDILMSAALGDVDRVRRFLEQDPASVRTMVCEEFFPKRDPRAGGTIYIWTLGWHQTAHTIAREFGHEAIYRLLMDRTPDAMKLGVAALAGDEELVRKLMVTRPDLAAALTDDDRRLLVHAAARENLHAVRAMLAAGWPADARGRDNVTPLHWAAFHGNAEIAGELLRHGAPLDVRDNEFHALPLGWAIYGSVNGWHPDRGDFAGVAQALLDAGTVAPEGAEESGSSPVRDVLRRHRERGHANS
ncbi:MAG: ankyrin repeat domain-containing protein [Vicinamibacterales bacterium]